MEEKQLKIEDKLFSTGDEQELVLEKCFDCRKYVGDKCEGYNKLVKELSYMDIFNCNNREVFE